MVKILGEVSLRMYVHLRAVGRSENMGGGAISNPRSLKEKVFLVGISVIK